MAVGLLMAAVSCNAMCSVVSASSNELVVQISEGNVIICGYNGTSEELVIPSEYMGYPVTEISSLDCHSVTSVVIPESVTVIYGLRDCIALESITVDTDNPVYSSMDGILYNKDGTKLMHYPCNRQDEVFQIPDGVTAVEDYAFGVNRHLKTLVIPADTTQIFDYRFGNPSTFEEVIVSEDNPAFSSMDGVMFDKDKTDLLYYPPAKKGSAYTIPSGVQLLGEMAFTVCENLTSLVIPRSVTELGYGAINCANLTDIYYEGTEEEWSAVEIGIYGNSFDESMIHYNSNGAVLNLGDINCDGTVNVLDVIRLNKNLLSGEGLSEYGIQNADVDGDGTPSVADSLLILKYIIKLVDTL